MAKRILFDVIDRATGVRLDTAGLSYEISAAKEVIVSVGVFGSPQLLQASSIGPTKLLSQHGFPVVVDRPGVGEGMQNHFYFTIECISAAGFVGYQDSTTAAPTDGQNYASLDTSVNPAINPNFLPDPVDIEFRIGEQYFPGNGTQTDDEIKASIREEYNTTLHGS
ncbi:hypothetical protein VPNG_00852 [Cytospora leucostoma]|uniref:Glucose-methanol-choline oxidoreductase N-terminal domain-containing protein n=1 Tax=Cytospora leucostoma TaxID=1230097 RepID=A0A423XMG1_9PEZI|nr:hypothetical protein VPNG_00852 [Cytospora leucostoma]